MLSPSKGATIAPMSDLDADAGPDAVVFLSSFPPTSSPPLSAPDATVPTITGDSNRNPLGLSPLQVAKSLMATNQSATHEEQHDSFPESPPNLPLHALHSFSAGTNPSNASDDDKHHRHHPSGAGLLATGRHRTISPGAAGPSGGAAGSGSPGGGHAGQHQHHATSAHHALSGLGLKRKESAFSGAALQLFSRSNTLAAENRKRDRVVHAQLLPFSTSRVTWDMAIFALITVNTVVTPLRISILTNLPPSHPLILADYAIDLFFLADTILRGVLPYRDPTTGEIVTDRLAIRTMYLKSGSLKINAVACLPILEMVARLAAGSQGIGVPREVVNLFRMVRVLNYPNFFRDLKVYLSRSSPLNESQFRMNQIFFFTFTTLTILGCFYFFTAVAQYTKGGKTFCERLSDEGDTVVLDGPPTWIFSDPVISGAIEDQSECAPNYGLFFFRGLHFTMQTLFTIGYGDGVVPNPSSFREIALACFIMQVGIFGYGTIIANMTSVIANVDVVSMRYRQEMDMIAQWMEVRSMPTALRDRIATYFHYMYRKQKGMLDNDMFRDLPTQLRRDFAELNLSLVTKVPFFSTAIRSQHFVKCVSNAMEVRCYAPGAYILYQFETQRELVIVKEGRVDICIKSAKEAVGSLTPGDYYGDYQLLFGTVNQVGLRAPDFCEVLVLTFTAFEVVCDDPSAAFLSFRTIGGSFRLSNDAGVIETIKTYKSTMKKLGVMVNNVTSSKKSDKMKNMMEKMEVIVKGIMIYPESKLHVLFDSMRLLFTLYYCIAIPVRICWNLTGMGFRDINTSSGMWNSFDYVLILEYLIDIVFVLDMCARGYCYSFIDYETGRVAVVTDRQRIWSKYKSSPRFRLDVLIAFPWDILGAIIGGYYSAFRLPKILRFLQLFNCISQLQTHLDDSMGITLLEMHVSMAGMAVTTVLVLVWSSVGWNIFRNYQIDCSERAPCDKGLDCILSNDPAICPNENFIFSVYWSLTTFATVGYGDLNPATLNQTVYNFFIGSFGAVFFAGIIANVTSFLHDVDVSEENIEHKINSLKWYMEGHNVSVDFIAKIEDYFSHVQRDQDGLSEDIMLVKSVPTHLRKDILVHITSQMVLNCDFFRGCEGGFLRKIMISLEQSFFSTLFMIMTTETPATGMYFIKSGVVELMSDKNGKLVLNTRLTTDESFAEGCLLEYWVENPFVARAGTDCELWFLARTTFNRLVDDFPDVKHNLGQLQEKALQSKKRAMTVVHRQTVFLATDRAEARSWIIHPDNLFVQVWFFIVLLFTLYNIIAVPFRAAYLENHHIDYSVIIDYIGDVVMIVDVIIRSSFLGFYDDGHLRSERALIRKHYWKSGEWKIHFIAMFPFDVILTFAIGVQCPFGILQVWSFLRINKCARGLEIRNLTVKMENSIAKAGIAVSKNGFRLLKLILSILLSAHWIGCMFFMIANADQHTHLNPDYAGAARNWLELHGHNIVDSEPKCDGKTLPSGDRVVQQYVASLYWAVITMTTVGYGDIHTVNQNEAIFNIFVMLFGNSIYTLVVANIDEIVSQMDVTASLHKMKVDKVKFYVEVQGLPSEMKQKVNNYYDSCWRSQKGVNGRKLLKYMPRALRAELLFELLNDLLIQTFFVKDCTSDFVSCILERLSMDSYAGGDPLFNIGERADDLYFIYSGSIDLLTEGNVLFKSVNDCILGDSCFFRREPHICNAKAADSCEVFTLTFINFWECLHDANLCESYVQFLDDNHSELMKFNKMVEKMTANLNSSKMAKMMNVVSKEKLPRHIILPDSNFRRAWKCGAFFFGLAYILIIPYRAAYGKGDTFPGYVAIDVFSDLFFIADVYAHFKHFAEMRDGYLVSNEDEFRIMYKHGEFPVDLISILPLSHLAMIGGVRDSRLIGALRLINLVRAVRMPAYMDNIIACFDDYLHVQISTSALRIFQMFFVVLALSHWFSCIYFAASRGDQDGWIVVDGKEHADTQLIYMRGYYFSLYTIATIGYGSVPCNTVRERLLAMFMCIVGSVTCDAGITAVLTSLISNRDAQAGTNHRRTECCSKFMQTAMVDEEFRKRVLSFYFYADGELNNLEENEILKDFSVPIARNILHFFCYKPLRAAPLCAGMKDGGVHSIVNALSAYIAVPGEKLSEIGAPCKSLFILLKGRTTGTDLTGHAEEIPNGGLIGHIATESSFEALGNLTRAVEVTFLSARGQGLTAEDPYASFKCGVKSCRTAVKKSMKWNETKFVKIYDKPPLKCTVSLMNHKKFEADVEIGKCEIDIGKDKGTPEAHDLYNEKKEKVGVVSISFKLYQLSSEDVPETSELTVVSAEFSHLYTVDAAEIVAIKDFLLLSLLPDVRQRLPMTGDERAPGDNKSPTPASPASQASLGDGVQVDASSTSPVPTNRERDVAWRRPSRPLTLVDPSVVKKGREILQTLKAIDDDEGERRMSGERRGSDSDSMRGSSMRGKSGISLQRADSFVDGDSKPAAKEVNLEEMEKKAKRRNSITSSTSEFGNKNTVVVERADGTLISEQVRGLRKSGWFGTGQVRPQTMGQHQLQEFLPSPDELAGDWWDSDEDDGEAAAEESPAKKERSKRSGKQPSVPDVKVVSVPVETAASPENGVAAGTAAVSAPKGSLKVSKYSSGHFNVSGAGGELEDRPAPASVGSGARFADFSAAAVPADSQEAEAVTPNKAKKSASFKFVEGSGDEIDEKSANVVEASDRDRAVLELMKDDDASQGPVNSGLQVASKLKQQMSNVRTKRSFASRDWDNVVDIPGLKYDRAAARDEPFFIEWAAAGGAGKESNGDAKKKK